MRKYYQAALTLTAIFSLLALLFYRHEYNKLRFVLQVFNYFGTPNQNNIVNCTNHIPMINSDSGEFSMSLSSWHRLSDDLYLYSAYDNNEGEIQAIGFGRVMNNLDYSCNILFDDNVEATAGQFTYAVMNESMNIDNEYCGYLFICKYTEMQNGVIVGVEFFDDANQKFNQVSVLQVQSLNNKINKTKNFICIAPPLIKPMKHRDMISFLAFHDHIGWDNFIVYDFGISHIFNNGLRKMSKYANDRWNFSYVTVPWNFPYPQISQQTIQTVIEADCLYRTYNTANLAITLTWDEYINLKYHNSVENVLTDLEKEYGTTMNKFRLNTQVFCIDRKEGNLLTSTPSILRTTRRLKNTVKNQPRYIYKLEDVLNKKIIQRNMDDLVIINRYQQCNIKDEREISDDGVLRFAEYMPGEQIFQYYITGQLFSNLKI